MSKIRERPDGTYGGGWTVSVAGMPGEPRCPELDRLDSALRRVREPSIERELLVEAWLARMTWPEPPKPDEPVWITPEVTGDRSFAAWQDWLVKVACATFGLRPEDIAKPPEPPSSLFGIDVVVDPSMPPDVVEMCHADGRLAARWTNIGQPNATVKTYRNVGKAAEALKVA